MARESFKHDLALSLGMTVQQLSISMTEREFRRWWVYARERMLPSRRIEHGLAMVSLLIARVMGGNTSMSLSDFMIPDPQATAKQDRPEDIVAALGGGGVIRLGQRRKKKG